VLSPVEAEREGANGVGVVSRRHPQHRTGVEPAAQIAANRNVGAEADAHGLFQHRAQFGGPVGITALRWGVIRVRIVQVPIPAYLEVLLAGYQVVTGWNLENAIEQCALLGSAKRDRVIDRFRIPSSRHSGCKQRLDLRREIKRPFVLGIEERLDAEAVTRREY